MTFKEQIDLYVKDLVVKGASKSAAYPPLYRLLCKLGFKPKPPLFASVYQNTILPAIVAGIIWALIMRLTVWQDYPVSTVFLAGFSFAVLTSFANYYQISRNKKKYGISGSWENYTSKLEKLPLANKTLHPIPSPSRSEPISKSKH
ncbi:DUF6404 family protein [Rubritalea sp.]|uniref:DUF6404 family protein n=1 Tax=Rubritalea sp. TaxID=2109375 RepID=UPI003EFAA0A9